MPSKVFISYRRDEAKWQAREIYGALKQELPPDHVFMDTETMPIGIDFPEYLEAWVDQCDIMLALIGPGWAEAIDPKTGKRRLEDPNDFVRIEVRRGLARGIPVVPILLDGAQLPDAARLPDDLRPLVRRNAEFIDLRTVDTDVERLIRRLRLTEQPGQSAPTNPVAAPPSGASVGAEGRAEVDAKVVQGAEGRRQVRRWIAAAIAAVLTIAFVGGLILAAVERQRLQAAAERDPVSVKPGSGESFIDRLADWGALP
jgi:hypothetical protein